MNALRRALSSAPLLLAAGLLLGGTSACSDAAGASAPQTAVAAPRPTAPEDTAPARATDDADDARLALLETAFRAASKFPLDPHGKNRSRAQQRVIDALLELGHAERALDLAERIADWRRGVALADAALVRLERGETDAVRPLLMEAEALIDAMARDADTQAWRRDELRVRVARAWRLLGEPARAAPHETDLEDAQAGQLAAARARELPPESFDAQLAALDAVVAAGGLDPVRAALGTFVALYEVNHADAERRALLEQRLRDAFERAQLPPLVRLDTLVDLADAALVHDDRATALRLARDAARLVADGRWLPQHQIQLTAQLAGLLQRAGRPDEARAEVEVALAMYDAARERIVDIERADALLPVAETLADLGDTQAALAQWSRALDEGLHNPNSRPRCDDLVGVCVSLATHGVTPPPALLARVRAITEQLGEPW